jgi:hypothetical protein
MTKLGSARKSKSDSSSNKDSETENSNKNLKVCDKKVCGKKRAATSPVQQKAASRKLNVEMNEETLRQLLKANSKEDFERNEAARKEDRDLLSTIDDISKESRTMSKT